MEKAIIKHLETAERTHEMASLIMISQMLNSDQLYEKAKNKLIQHTELLQPEDAYRIGAKAVYEVMLGRHADAPTQPGTTFCSICRCTRQFALCCRSCGNWK
jgi:hypothetical protein